MFITAILDKESNSIIQTKPSVLEPKNKEGIAVEVKGTGIRKLFSCFLTIYNMYCPFSLYKSHLLHLIYFIAAGSSATVVKPIGKYKQMAMVKNY